MSLKIRIKKVEDKKGLNKKRTVMKISYKEKNSDGSIHTYDSPDNEDISGVNPEDVIHITFQTYK